MKKFSIIKESTTTKKDIKNILYLHGLGGHLHKSYKKTIEKSNIQYIGLSVNYKMGPIWDIISEMKIDAVIGHSLGGYLAYYLSNHKNIPCLLLMPCFDDEMFKLQPIPKEVLDLEKNVANKIALIGSLDESVNKEKQSQYLKGIKTYTEEIDHDMTDDLFSKYLSIFIK